MSNFFKYRGYVFISLLIIGGVFFLGLEIGKSERLEAEKVGSILNTKTSTSTPDFMIFWKAWDIINEKYIPTNGTSTERVSDQVRIYGAIQGMVGSLGDPYTMFFPPVENKTFNEEISGNFEGVGMEVDVKDGVLTVIAPLKGTPAYRAGIKTADKILQIDDLSTSQLNTVEAIKHIKGPKGTTVKLLISRDSVKEPFELSVVRDVIEIPTVNTETINDVFVIHLYSFSAISPNLFRNSLREFIDSGKYKLIIDLRGNPGGYLEASIDMASWFLPAGKMIVSEDFRDKSKNRDFRSKGYNIFNEKLKLAILIDGGSASAAEILAGALHEQGAATLIGTQSFGKGSVQELVDITDDTSLKVTVAKWLTPNGTSISHGGLTPDIVVKLDEEEFKKGKDNQIQAALEFLAK